MSESSLEKYNFQLSFTSSKLIKQIRFAEFDTRPKVLTLCGLKLLESYYDLVLRRCIINLSDKTNDNFNIIRDAANSKAHSDNTTFIDGSRIDVFSINNIDGTSFDSSYLFDIVYTDNGVTEYIETIKC